jgi:cytoplasmic iron level regulating protein YaaA (DUF328/UPF0246 family)
MYSASALFRYAFGYCQRHYDRVFILSAKYGLLHPDAVIEPYNVTLKAMTRAERNEWGTKIADDIKRTLQPTDVLYFHTGRDYSDPLLGLVPQECVQPLEGMSIGWRLHFYRSET